MSPAKDRHVIIIGGGLVGSLIANFMAKRNYKVTLYEYRDDNRHNHSFRGRSINLALSNRGRRALSAIGLERIVLDKAVPMYGRYLHQPTGRTKSIAYDSYKKQCIYSVGRNDLNQILLEYLDRYPNVEIHFNHKLIHVNLEEETVTVLNTKTQQTVMCTADLIIGADGAYSTVRKAIQQRPLFDYNQTYIEHGYLELSIPPENCNKIQPNHLHIWPRNDFMMIALPNRDKSWTVTLFMPFKQFECLTNRDKLIEFFVATFPDTLDLIGVDHLVRDFFTNKPSPLVSIKCNRYHYGCKFMIIGDAAHTMVPFYGQGVNAGFEDCWIFDQILAKNREDFAKSIEEFSEVRRHDAYAICELAFYNYVEMRDLVTRRSYWLRRTIDDYLYRFFPNHWVPLYNAVTFSEMSYNNCIRHRQWQDKLLMQLFWLIIAFLSVLFVLCFY